MTQGINIFWEGQLEENMTEEQFIAEARKKGVTINNIARSLKMKDKLILSYEELLEASVDVQNKMNIDGEKFVSVD